MKKILTILLVAVLVLSVTACGNKKDKDTYEAPTTPAVEETQEKETATEGETVTDTVSNGDEKTDEPEKTENKKADEPRATENTEDKKTDEPKSYKNTDNKQEEGKPPIPTSKDFPIELEEIAD